MSLRMSRGITLRQVAPNAITAMALCFGLTAIRYGISGEWQLAVDQPRKAAGFLTGVPAPAGAGIALLPLYAWFITGLDVFRDWRLVAPWIVVSAFLMISSLPTLGWKGLRVPPAWRLFAILLAGVFAASLMVAPWHALLILSVAYIALLPVGIISYARVQRRLAGASSTQQD